MKKVQFLLFSVLFLTLSIILSSFTGILSNKTRYVKNVENILNQKIEKVHAYFIRFDKAHKNEIPKIVDDLEKEGIILLKYYKDSLIFWSSNSIPVNNVFEDSTYKNHIVNFYNSYYYAEMYEHDSNTCIGLINLANRYPYENEFLHSGFNRSFRLPSDADIGSDPGKGYSLYDKEGNFLFSIIVPKQTRSAGPQSIIATLFLFAGLILFAYFIILLLNGMTNSGKRFRFILVILISLILLRFIQLKLVLGFGGFVLFDPYIYAASEFIPSLGDLLLNSMIIFFMVILIYRFIDFPFVADRKKKGINTLLLIAYILILLVFFLYAHYSSHSLVYNSRISFRLNETDQISIYSLISIFINGLNYFSAGLILIRILQKSTKHIDYLIFLQVYGFTTAIVFAGIFLIFGYPLDSISIVFFYLISIVMGILNYKRNDISGYSLQVLLLLIFSVYSLAYMISEGSKKEYSVKSSLALSLSNEHDPVAEYLFEELSEKIETDTFLINRLNEQMIGIDELFNYLGKNYFTGFWSKYNMQITRCRPIDSVLIEVPDYQWFHCYDFFDAMIDEIGLNLPNTRFFYLDKKTGRISYLGRFPFVLEGPDQEITLFIELDSRLTRNLLGYPRLLLDEVLQKDRIIEKYSYAKYYKGSLVTQSGDFNYSLSDDIFGTSNLEFRKIKLDGYHHLLYQPEKDNLIVLSSPGIKFIDIIVGFSYIFLFYYLCLMLVIIIRNMSRSGFRPLNNLRNKIQFSIIGILIISLLLIASGTIWLNIRNYKKNQDNILHEKIQSVLIELKHKLAYEDVLEFYWSTANYDNLDQLLIKFSDVFYSDINLYDPQGALLATSRYEIFDLDLQGDKMDPIAYYRLHSEKRAQFIHREKIGELTYQSAYVPFENMEGKLLAYLNLPYFTKQKEFQTALSALIVTIINIYVILFLITIVISIFISNQITRPLEMLQQRFRQLKIGDRHEEIYYRRKDEIGRLVEEYNRMVRELEKSVDLLARSERESAWREMAKQIAHEIKNPLTPMRLSVQQLQKIWSDKREDFDKYLESVSATLIEQIDNLSEIASEFSNFAKMPEIKSETVDVVDVVRKCVKLFEGSAAYSITFKTTGEKLLITSDKEQLSRVLINLIKNGIQSIPDGKGGIVKVELQKNNKEVEIRISDNGRGIPDEVIPKMFMPNFTTKTSGMGLGLAIVKNIVEQLQGKIIFTTKLGKGTEFRLQFPA